MLVCIDDLLMRVCVYADISISMACVRVYVCACVYVRVYVCVSMCEYRRFHLHVLYVFMFYLLPQDDSYGDDKINLSSGRHFIQPAGMYVCMYENIPLPPSSLSSALLPTNWNHIQLENKYFIILARTTLYCTLPVQYSIYTY